MIQVRVECYAGYRADQRPVRFALRDQVYGIEEVQDQWYSPSEVYFRVRASDGGVYILRHDEVLDEWTLEGFRAARK